MDKVLRKEALEQLHYIDDTYGSVSKLEEGHPELIKLRMLYGCQLFVSERIEKQAVAETYKVKVKSGKKCKKTAVFHNGTKLNEFGSLKEAAAAVGINYSTALSRMYYGEKGKRDGYTFKYI